MPTCATFWASSPSRDSSTSRHDGSARMSGLAGLWNFDARPVDPAVMAAMGTAIAHRGIDQSCLWSDEAFGIACEPGGVASDSFGRVLAFDGRLDNRDELLAAMRAANCSSESSDS